MSLHIFVFSLLMLTGVQAQGGSELESRTITNQEALAVHWHLDRRGHQGRQGILFLAQGSGCDSPIHSEASETASNLAPQHAIVLLEKRGLAPGFMPDGDDCPDSFHDQHTLSGWVSDLVEIMAELRQTDWWNGELVLIGGSEGGAMVTLAAGQIPETDALVVVVSGLGLPFSELLKAVVPPEVAGMLEKQFEAIRANPDSSEVWSEHAFRWWAEVLDRDFIDDLLALDIPILLIQGDRDEMVPVQSARLVQAAFADQERTNLTYREYPDLDHSLVDSDGNRHLERIIGEAADWLASVRDPQEHSAAVSQPQKWFDQRDYARLAAWLENQDPDQSESRYWQTRLALINGQGGPGLEMAEALVAEHGDQARFHILLAEARAANLDGVGRIGQLRAARRIRAAYETAIELEPDNIDAHYGLFVYALQAPAMVGGGSNRARELAERLKSLNPAWGAFAKASLAAADGQTEARRAALASALEHDPQHAMARFSAGLLETAEGQWESAQAHFRILVEAMPLHMGAWYQIGRIAALSGQDLDAGREALQRYLETEHGPGHPSMAAAHWRLGQIEQHAGDAERARRHFLTALELDPDLEAARGALRGLNPS